MSKFQFHIQTQLLHKHTQRQDRVFFLTPTSNLGNVGPKNPIPITEVLRHCESPQTSRGGGGGIISTVCGIAEEELGEVGDLVGADGVTALVVVVDPRDSREDTDTEDTEAQQARNSKGSQDS